VSRSFLRFLALTIAIGAACAYPRYSAGRQYFAWVNLYVEPPVPDKPITAGEAQAIAMEGGVFYVAEHDRDGQLLTLSKTYQGQTVVIYSKDESAKDSRPRR
jgi:hypothetical protein